MNQNVKFKYNHKYITFFISFKGVEVEVLRAAMPADVIEVLPTIKRLRPIAQNNANGLMADLKRAA